MTTATATPAPLEALVRHFADLRDGDHFGEVTRLGKEAAFQRAVEFLDAPARQVLEEFNSYLLLDTGQIDFTGLHRDAHGGLLASWLLSWPEQKAAGLVPISIIAIYGAGFHHPHLRGATVAQWPLNVATADHAWELVPVLRSIAGSDIEDLVYQVGGNWRIVPATAQNRTGELIAS